MVEIIITIFMVILAGLAVYFGMAISDWIVFLIFGPRLREIIEIEFYIIFISTLILAEKAHLPINFPNTEIPISCFIALMGVFFTIGVLISLLVMSVLLSIAIVYIISPKFRFTIRHLRRFKNDPSNA